MFATISQLQIFCTKIFVIFFSTIIIGTGRGCQYEVINICSKSLLSFSPPLLVGEVGGVKGMLWAEATYTEYYTMVMMIVMMIMMMILMSGVIIIMIKSMIWNKAMRVNVNNNGVDNFSGCFQLSSPFSPFPYYDHHHNSSHVECFEPLRISRVVLQVLVILIVLVLLLRPHWGRVVAQVWVVARQVGPARTLQFETFIGKHMYDLIKVQKRSKA